MASTKSFSILCKRRTGSRKKIKYVENPFDGLIEEDPPTQEHIRWSGFDIDTDSGFDIQTIFDDCDKIRARYLVRRLDRLSVGYNNLIARPVCLPTCCRRPDVHLQHELVNSATVGIVTVNKPSWTSKRRRPNQFIQAILNPVASRLLFAVRRSAVRHTFPGIDLVAEVAVGDAILVLIFEWRRNLQWTSMVCPFFGLPEDDLAVEGGPIWAIHVCPLPTHGWRTSFGWRNVSSSPNNSAILSAFFQRFPFDRVEHLSRSELGPKVDGLSGLPFVVESGTGLPCHGSLG